MYGFLPRPDLVTSARAPATAAASRAPDAARRAFAPLPTAPAAAPALPLASEQLTTDEQFRAISEPAADLVANGRLTKFFIDQRDASHPEVRFVNANFTRNGTVPDAAKYHYFFAREVFDVPEDLGEFNRITYFTPGEKRYVAGVVHSYELAGRPGPILGLQFYPQDLIAEQPLLAALRTVQAQITIPDAHLAFVPTGSQQTTTRIAAGLAAAGIEVVTLDQILGAITYVPLNRGEAWGHLRVFPADHDDLRPTDIVVFDELPLDLSVVAGVLTRAVQDTNSHVNLKSKERNTPNAVLRDASPTNPRLAPFIDQPVHFVVGAENFTIEPTTEEVVTDKLAERMNRPLVPLRWTKERRLRSYAEMARRTPANTLALARRYGAKAANLGFLTHRQVLGQAAQSGTASGEVGYDLVPAGFGVPFQFYADFVTHAPNETLRTRIAELVAAERAGDLSPKELAKLVAGVQDAFLSGHFPPGQLEALRAKLDEVLPGVKKIKVRSSANAEDIPNFDGAGLHDSFAANTEKEDDPCGTARIVEEVDPDDGDGGETKRKVKPKSMASAVKAVYASLWNKRAVEERSFARIDQSTVAMGLAIVAAYDSESDVAANAVVVTRVLNTDAVYGYSLSIQEGNNLVTNPDPGTHSEVTIAGFVDDEEPISFTVTRFAQPTRDGPQRTAPVLAPERTVQLVELTKRVERAYCAAKRSYYDGPCELVTADNTKPASLDLEVKVLENEQLVIKQVRQFGGT